MSILASKDITPYAPLLDLLASNSCPYPRSLSIFPTSGFIKRHSLKKQIPGSPILQPKLGPLQRHDPSSDTCQSAPSMPIYLSCTISLLHHRVSLLKISPVDPPASAARPHLACETDSYIKVFASLPFQGEVPLQPSVAFRSRSV